jgi:hypothetical protein
VIDRLVRRARPQTPQTRTALLTRGLAQKKMPAGVRGRGHPKPAGGAVATTSARARIGGLLLGRIVAKPFDVGDVLRTTSRCLVLDQVLS